MQYSPLKTRKVHHSPLFWAALVAAGLLMFLVSSRIHAREPSAQAISRSYLRAGPFPDFPVVGVVPPRGWVRLDGCLPDWSWCQVGWNNLVGWTPSADIGVDRQGWIHTVEGVYWFNGPPIIPFYRSRFIPGTDTPAMSQAQPFPLRPTAPLQQQDIIDRTPRLPPIIVVPSPW